MSLQKSPWLMKALHSLICVALLAGCWFAHAHAQTPPTERKPLVAMMVLRPHGFEPSSIEITAGRVLFAVYNRTGLDEVNLRIKQENDTVRVVDILLREERLRLGKRVLGLDFELTPGTYVVTEAEHPTWKCRVTVKLPRN